MPTDNYGSELVIPLVAPVTGTAAGDPAISIFGDFFAAVLNANAQVAWTAVAPAVTTATMVVTMPVVRTILTQDPRLISFDEKQLPAIYMDRTSGQADYWMTEDWRVSPDKWTLLWVFPPSVQSTARQRNSITNALHKVIDRAVEKVRDPAYVMTDDPDLTAATTPANPVALLDPTATSTSARHYTSINLKPLVVGPPRFPTVTVGGTASSTIAGSTVTFTGHGAEGQPRTSVVILSGALGTFTGDWLMTGFDTVDVQSQAGTAATIALGLSAFAGLGSIAMVLAGLQSITVSGWRDITFSLSVRGSDEPRTYNALEVTFDVVQQLHRADGDDFDDPAVVAELTQEDGTVTGTLYLP